MCRNPMKENFRFQVSYGCYCLQGYSAYCVGSILIKNSQSFFRFSSSSTSLLGAILLGRFSLRLWIDQKRYSPIDHLSSKKSISSTTVISVGDGNGYGFLPERSYS